MGCGKSKTDNAKDYLEYLEVAKKLKKINLIYFLQNRK